MSSFLLSSQVHHQIITVLTGTSIHSIFSLILDMYPQHRGAFRPRGIPRHCQPNRGGVSVRPRRIRSEGYWRPVVRFFFSFEKEMEGGAGGPRHVKQRGTTPIVEPGDMYLFPENIRLLLNTMETVQMDHAAVELCRRCHYPDIQHSGCSRLSCIIMCE